MKISICSCCSGISALRTEIISKVAGNIVLKQKQHALKRNAIKRIRRNRRQWDRFCAFGRPPSCEIPFVSACTNGFAGYLASSDSGYLNRVRVNHPHQSARFALASNWLLFVVLRSFFNVNFLTLLHLLLTQQFTRKFHHGLLWIFFQRTCLLLQHFLWLKFICKIFRQQTYMFASLIFL